MEETQEAEKEVKTYGKTWCHICKAVITTAGAGKVSHMRGHVRRGEATEHTYKVGKRTYRTFEATKKTGLLP